MGAVMVGAIVCQHDEVERALDVKSIWYFQIRDPPQ